MMAFYRCVPMQKSVLPAGYKPCRYLQGGSTQYIDTGICAEISDTVKPVISIKCEILPDTEFNQRIFGSNIGAISFFQFFINVNADGFGFQAFNTPPYTTFTKDTIEHTYVFDFAQRKACQDELWKTISFVNGKHNIPMFLFARDTDGKANNFFYGKIYDFSYDDGNQHVSFIPCLDISGKPCMFDLISRKPFYNMGTGEFGYELMDGTYVAPI